MPTYEYECDSCGHSFEAFQGITDKKLRKCPKCKAFSLSRLIGSGTGIIFKGTGFYETDYKPKKAPAETPDTSKTGKSPEKSVPAGSDAASSKPAAVA